jgi:broad specificity phosphatase PhoE
MQRFDYLFLRHAERPSFESDSWGHEVSITSQGEKEAQEMGKTLERGFDYDFWSSPIKRCIQTAAAICQGLCATMPIQESSLLGGPGFFIEDPKKTATLFATYPLPALINLYLKEKTLPGFFPFEQACKRVLFTLFQHKKNPSIWVTHDICVTILACFLFNRESCQGFLPDFLEGILMRKERDGVSIVYKGHKTKMDDTLFKGMTLSS